MLVENIILSAGVTVLSLGLLIVSLASYRKYKNMKLLFISLVFVIFVVKGMLLSFNLLAEDLLNLSLDPRLVVFDVVILLLLYIALLKR